MEHNEQSMEHSLQQLVEVDLQHLGQIVNTNKREQNQNNIPFIAQYLETLKLNN